MARARRVLFTGGAALALLVACAFADAFDREVDAWADTIAGKACAKACPTLAVVDLVDSNGRPNRLGQYLGEQLSVRLSQRSELKVVDRSHLDAVLREHKLVASGPFDQAQARRLGSLAGADAIVTGSVTAIADRFDVTIKVLDVETGAILAAVAGRIDKTASREDLYRQRTEPEEPARKPAPKARSGPQPIQIKGVVFDLERCVLSGQIVTCALTVQNRGSEAARLSVTKDTKLADTSRNARYVDEARIGGRPALTAEGVRQPAMLRPGETTTIEALFHGMADADRRRSYTLSLVCENLGDPLPAAFEGIQLELLAIEPLRPR